MRCDEFHQSFAPLPCGSKPWIRVTKPTECGVDKFIRGRSTSARTFPIERPAKDQLRRTVMISSHPPEPMVNERRLSDTGPGNDCNDIDIPVGPCTIQEVDILLSAKNIASSNGQSSY